MIIDCARCDLRQLACGDCAGAALPARAEITEVERRALAALAGAGMIAPLRFRPAQTTPAALAGWEITLNMAEAVETASALN